jgi:hypothetical protein
MRFLVPVHCFFKVPLETETPILFFDHRLKAHNGKRVARIDTDFPSENNSPIVLLLVFFFFWISEIHCY